MRIVLRIDPVETTMEKIIKTEHLANFCGGCNNTVILKRFIQIDEDQLLEEAWKEKYKNENDELFKRLRFMGFCLCGNVYLKV